MDTLIPNGYNTLPPGITLGEFLRIPILQIDMKTLEVLDRFESMTEVEQELGIKQSSLSRVCGDENNGSISAGGYYWVKESEHFEGWEPHNQWEVLQIEPETLEVVRTYKNVSEAKKELGISGLYSAVAGENIMSNGFHWVYAKDYNKNWKPKESKREVKVQQLDKATREVVAQFNSIKAAAASVETTPQNISAALDRRTKTAAGYRWRRVK